MQSHIYRLTIYLFFIGGLLSCRNAAKTPTVVISDTYSNIAQQLQEIIPSELESKNIPAISIAIVDDQELVYAQGFGFQDEAKKIPADMHTVYRIGSVSKLFTDIAVMQEVEKGKLNLDAPITNFLPDFKPENPFEGEISLRHLMSHRAGLVREPPVGHYFDDTEPSLAATVESLHETNLVYAPGARTKYSNAGIAVVGYVLEKLNNQAFADYLGATLLGSLGMEHSAFQPNPYIKQHLADARMWTYDGRDFPAPTFELGMAPAGSMYAPVTDLAKFMKVIFQKGKLPKEGEMLSEESLEAMWKPQFAKEGAETGYGLGFSIGKLDGHRLIGHGGAIYGFSTEIMMLPEEKLGVVVVGSKDFSNSVMDRIGAYALRAAIAQKSGEDLPEWNFSESIGAELATKMEGTYQLDQAQIDLIARGDRLYQEGRTYKMELKRKAGDTLIIDDALGYGGKIYLDEEGALHIGENILNRIEPKIPAELPSEQKAFIGEYGWDYNTLYILERRGQLHVQIEWFPMYSVEKVGEDLYSFPDYGLYHGEQLEFVRDENGNISGVQAAAILFAKRLQNIADGKTFQITPVKPTDELRQIALEANPPEEEGNFKNPDLVDLQSLDPTIKYDIRYASDNNFMGIPFYLQSKAFMQRPAAEAVVRIHQKLKQQGLGLLIHDAYRPWYVTKMFWDATPEEHKHFVADPAAGSRHNRGCAVDLTLFDLQSGEVIQMVGGYDEFSPRSYPDYPGGTERQRYYRELLRDAMEAEGFSVYEWEWWHFDYRDWRSYGIGSETFEELEE